jgi:hypothetical protein
VIEAGIERRYGDSAIRTPYGVETVSRELHTPAHMAHMGGQAVRLVTWLVESNWQEREIGPRAMRGTERVRFAERAQPAQPWTRVNNCTQNLEARVLGCPPEFGPAPQAGRKAHSASEKGL